MQEFSPEFDSDLSPKLSPVRGCGLERDGPAQWAQFQANRKTGIT